MDGSLQLNYLRAAMRTGIALLLAVALAGTGVAMETHDQARDGRGREPVGIETAQADFVPLESILRALRARYSGHQLSVSGPNRSGGSFVYEIKWLTDDGRVLYVTADAETGAILSVEGG